MKCFALAIFAALVAAPLFADAGGTARAECLGPCLLFYGSTNDCDGPNLGGHLPDGFACRGTGTGEGICVKPGDNRIIRYEVGAPSNLPGGLCRLDFSKADHGDLKRVFQYLRCKGPMPDCATAAFSKGDAK